MNDPPHVPDLVTGRGVFARCRPLIASQRVLVVASPGALRRTGLAGWLPPASQVFSRFQPSPTLGQAVTAARVREAFEPDIVLGVGGGSALDVAKAACVLPGDLAAARAVLSGEMSPRRAAVRLVLVPTTAGTGTEVTRFATLYRRKLKVSLDVDEVRADLAFVDPALTDSCPAPLTWNCAFDVMAHAVESLWSRRSTSQSRAFAEAALIRVVPILSQAADVPTPSQRDRLSEAATLAGQAIDVTRTTAAHAFAYPLTGHLGIPHGFACAMNLTWLAPLVECASPDRITDDRGAGIVRAAVESLQKVFGRPAGVAPGGLAEAIQALLDRRRAHAACRAVGVGDGVIGQILREGLSSCRVGNTPVRLEAEHVRAALTGALESYVTGNLERSGRGSRSPASWLAGRRAGQGRPAGGNIPIRCHTTRLS
jgi:alcohol dehydrogenase class IV